MAYTYDANGNTVRKVTPAGPIDYTYDDANRLAELRQASERTTYAYDADGLRIGQTRYPATGDPVSTRYLQDPSYAYSQVVEQWRKEGAGPTQLEATYAFADDLIAQTRYVGAAATTAYVQMDGFGSVRWLTDAAGAVTDAVEYDAFGNEVARQGATPIEHLYRGEQFDSILGFYYLRARWMNPTSGRFTQQDSYLGDTSDPASLHKYLYAHADPINRWDPTGHYTADFGRAAENEVCNQYKARISTGAATECGKRAYFSFDEYLKPDIMDWGAFRFMEVKPFSPSGIVKGVAQLAAYTIAYAPVGFAPNTQWTPVPAMVDGTLTYFENLSGVIFYTDDMELGSELAAATLATAATMFRRHAARTATRVGADAMLRAVSNNAVRTITSANSGRLMFHMQTAMVATRYF